MGYDLIYTAASSGLDSKVLLEGRTLGTVVDLDLYYNTVYENLICFI